MKRTMLLASLMLISAAVPAAIRGGDRAGDVATGKRLYAADCAVCHGAEGEGLASASIPVLAGQEDWYLHRQLEAYRNGVRGKHADDIYGALMAPIAKDTREFRGPGTLDNIVAFIQTLKAPKPAPTVRGNADHGKTLYAVCAACHGDRAEGKKAFDAPRLNHQGDRYLVRQLENYKKGVRGAGPKDIYGQQMYGVAQTLAGEQDIRDVVSYINTLSTE